LPGLPFFERREQPVPDQLVEGGLARVVLFGYPDQRIERRRALWGGGSSGDPGKRRESVPELGGRFGEADLGTPSRAGGCGLEQPADASGRVGSGL
jgi:hypothetical protein